MIEITGLVKKYGNTTAVDHLTLTVEPGKVYGFLGPNGAGKSTTMNIITGYTAATEGTVRIDGHDIQEEPEAAKKCIGYLPEFPPLYPDMKVREYLEFAAELKRIGRKQRRPMVDEVMELTGIEEEEDRLIRNLSKGYRQRVGLAQAILGYPDVIILDEPTVGLDPKQIIEIRELIRKLGENHTVILSSHILSEVRAVCDHVFILSKGKLAASDTTENLLNLMSGAQELQLKVRCGKRDAEKIFSRIEGVDHIAERHCEEKDCYACSIFAKAEQDLRERVFHAASQAGMAILEMNEITRTLEDVFLELTEEGEAN